ncbi:MAG: glycosyltransferase, partial [Myxococcales bacterium]|nr:glycosyltransferase [Myxococcales bacterium]
ALIRGSSYLARPEVPHVVESEGEGSILCYFRDGTGGSWMEALLEEGKRVIYFGKPSDAPTGVECYAPDRAAFLRYLAGCDAVVGSAGSNLVAECVLLGKPLLALHHTRDFEQRLNAAMLSHSGVGLGAAISASPKPILERFLTRIAASGFSRFDLAEALPPVAEVVVDQAEHLL